MGRLHPYGVQCDWRHRELDFLDDLRGVDRRSKREWINRYETRIGWQASQVHCDGDFVHPWSG